MLGTESSLVRDDLMAREFAVYGGPVGSRAMGDIE